MITAFLLFIAISPTPPLPEDPASKPAVTKDTRPDLFADEPPQIPGSNGEQSKSPPNETPMSFWVSNLVRTMLVLGFVVLLAYLLLNKGLGRLMKLTGTSVSGKHMTLIERTALDQKHSLFLVEVEGRRFVVGTSEHGTNLIAALDEKRETSLASATDKGTL